MTKYTYSDVESRVRVENIVKNDIFACVSSWVEDSMREGLIDFEIEVENIELDEDNLKEPLEWWLVSERLFYNLKDLKEVVIDSKYGYIWGRCCSGQLIELDSTMYKVLELIDRRYEEIVNKNK